LEIEIERIYGTSLFTFVLLLILLLCAMFVFWRFVWRPLKNCRLVLTKNSEWVSKQDKNCFIPPNLFGTLTFLSGPLGKDLPSPIPLHKGELALEAETDMKLDKYYTTSGKELTTTYLPEIASAELLAENPEIQAMYSKQVVEDKTNEVQEILNRWNNDASIKRGSATALSSEKKLHHLKDDKAVLRSLKSLLHLLDSAKNEKKPFRNSISDNFSSIRVKCS